MAGRLLKRWERARELAETAGGHMIRPVGNDFLVRWPSDTGGEVTLCSMEQLENEAAMTDFLQTLVS